MLTCGVFVDGKWQTIYGIHGSYGYYGKYDMDLSWIYHGFILYSMIYTISDTVFIVSMNCIELYHIL